MRNSSKGEDGAVENFEVSSHQFSQPSLPFLSPFFGLALPYPSPSVPNLPTSAFQSQFSTKNRETKREVCDRRFVGSVWSIRNKEWATLPACGASEGILIIWDSKKMSSEEVRQKAKVKWVKDGDCNSKLFHKVANGRRNRNFIKFLENERGLVLDNSKSITKEILLYFKRLYSSPPEESWRVEGIDWSPISEESASRLDSPFSEEEIFNAIFQLDRDKAPGPDGFTIAVF
ncbi:hypothetical protein CK203_014972 [Vitis vinifera]|uniref:Reverse transcriptase domain-containing protein n=1 Tax=Vitis vinifera TaxID=29760 RepID=A0A438JCV4_VITVI|nr:hypothetical protein CK203_014972 [Vitis vinifera]